MSTRKINFDFFTVKFGAKKDTFDEKLIKEHKKNTKTEIETFGYLLRIGSINQVKRNLAFPTMSDKNYVWIGAVERIDVKEEAYAGKKGVPGRNTYAAGEDEGPLKDTVFLYDPRTGVLILQRSRGGLNHSNMTNFISSLCHDDKVELSIMIDKKVLTKLNKLPTIKTIEYAVSVPNPESLSSKGRPIHGDINLLNKINGNKLNVVIGSDKDNQLNKKSSIDKVKDLLKTKQNVNRLVVKGYNNEDYEILDLINNRIEANKKVDAGRGKKVSFVHIMTTIEGIFRDKYKFIEDYTK